MVGDKVAFDFLLRDVQQTDDAARGTITVAGQCDARLKEFDRVCLLHVGLEVSVEVAPNERGAAARQGPVALLEETRLVDSVDLESLVGVPS